MKRHRPKDPATRVSRSIAWKVALAFLVGGVIWVVVTDLLLYRFVSDPVEIARLETAKAWTFIAVAMVLLYAFTNRLVLRLARYDATIQAIVGSIADGVLVVGRDSRINYVNTAGARLLGLVDGHELDGMRLDQFARRFRVGLEDGRVLAPEQYAAQRALGGENTPSYKAVFHPPGRPKLTAIFKGAPVRPIPEGPVALAVTVIHDITALEQLEEMRDAFVSSAAHTLKTPVAIISAHSQLLASGMTPSWRTSTEAIERQCELITRITDNLLVLARIRSQNLQLDPRSVDFADIVDTATQEMQDASPDHGLITNLHAHPKVFGDRNRLTLAIKNLIEVAYRRSVPRTDVEIELEELGARGRVSVSYEPLEPHDVLADHEVDAQIGALGLEHIVTAEVVAAVSGRLGSDTCEGRRRDWIEIPTIEGLHA